ncbi:hypothetical protein CAter282_1402 [Collimonas arenae]|uniref:Uncharacterized protein n=1 Tax=Collimonas arenae TaxID=279058 RepID=A0A127QGM3_9BURK|nr:hypothetical protein CAter282_1402 [Collimonas arenae]
MLQQLLYIGRLEFNGNRIYHGRIIALRSAYWLQFNGVFRA